MRKCSGDPGLRLRGLARRSWGSDWVNSRASELAAALIGQLAQVHRESIAASGGVARAGFVVGIH